MKVKKLKAEYAQTKQIGPLSAFGACNLQRHNSSTCFALTLLYSRRASGVAHIVGSKQNGIEHFALIFLSTSDLSYKWRSTFWSEYLTWALVYALAAQ